MPRLQPDDAPALSIEPVSDPYYTRGATSYGLQLRANDDVPEEAIQRAARTLHGMFRASNRGIPECFESHGAVLAIIPTEGSLTDLPGLEYLRGRLDPSGDPYDEVRGTGAVIGQVVTATSEENLLQVGGPQQRHDVTVHEVAHAVMNLCFTSDDHNRIEGIYSEAKRQNLYAGRYAMVRLHEFWAELSESFFSVNGGRDQEAIGGPDDIRRQVPAMWELLVSTYGHPEP